MALRFTFRTILPSLAGYTALLALAIFFDALLHRFGLAWVGRYLGIVGTALLMVSFLYSLRKRHYLRISTPKMLLRTHELLGWSGALALVVHGGIHFNALIPWVALTAMLIVVASGFTGQFLLKQARADHKAREAALLAQGVPRSAVDQELLAHALLVRSMQRWRTVHLPLTMVFCGFAVVHIAATFFLWGWR